jgi:hypothetical protein
MFFNKYFNASNDEEVVISNEVQLQQEDVVVADVDAGAQQPVQPKKQSYDAQFHFDEELYEKNYALAQSVQAQSQKALAEEKALAEAEVEAVEMKQAIGEWFVSSAYKNKHGKCGAYSYGAEPPMSTMPVLFIEEFLPLDSWCQYTTTDWRAYIYYDATTKSYVLNGTRRRRGESKTAHPDIRMTFASKSSLAFYLRKSMCARRHDLSITMYSVSRNVIHILSTPNAIPNFHSIHNCRSKFRSELFGYDNCHPSMRELKSYLKVLRDGTEGGVMFK